MASLNYNMTRTKVYTILLACAIVASIIALMVWMSKRSEPVSEHFTESGLADYNARLTTINVFDAYLKRNPTPAEIDKFSAHKNEQDILSAVMSAYPEAAAQKTKGQPASKVSQPDVIDKEDAGLVVVEEEMMYTPPQSQNVGATKTPATNSSALEAYEDAKGSKSESDVESALKLISDIRDESTSAVKNMNRRLNKLEDLLRNM